MTDKSYLLFFCVSTADKSDIINLIGFKFSFGISIG